MVAGVERGTPANGRDTMK
ncbi:hypothetical protein L195_g034011, partial [Trifolium pratense]